MPRRILITTPFFAPLSNGVAAVTSAHAMEFARRGHQVVVATGPAPANAVSDELSDVQVVRFTILGRGTRREPYGGDIESYQAFLRIWDGDVVLCHCWQAWSTDLAIPVLKEMRSKGVLISHGYEAHCRPPTVRFPHGTFTLLDWWPYVKQLPSFLKSFDHLVFLSDRADRHRFYDHFRSQQLGLQNCSVIPNGTFPADFKSGGDRFIRTYGLEGKKMVLQVANYEIRKNQEMALWSFAKSGCTNAVLVFVGSKETDYSQHVKQVYNRLRATRSMGPVLFLQELDRDMICSAYQAAILFLCSSFSEIQPLVILDAMAAGLPFLSTDVGCVSELPGGWILHSEREMALQIRTLLANESLRMELRQKGLQAVHATYNWTSVIDRYEDLLSRL